MNERAELYDRLSRALTNYEDAEDDDELDSAVEDMYDVLCDVQLYFSEYGINEEGED